MTHRFSQRLFLSAVAPALALGTPTGVVAGSVVRPVYAAGAVASGWMSPNARPRHQWLYVAGRNDVTIYDLNFNGTPQIGRIREGISTPGGIALDLSGTLYVPNENAATVTVYPPGAKFPSLTLTGTSNPEGVAVDSAGNVWVSNRGSSPGISVYPAGQTTPSQYLTSTLITSPDQLIFDSGGTLYISGGNGDISILPPGPSQTITPLGLSDVGPVPAGIAIDPQTGNLIVGDATEPPCLLSLYLAGQTTPRRQRTLDYGGLDFLGMGFLGKKEVVFVPNSQGNFVEAFKPSLKGDPLLTVSTESVAISVAFKPAGVP